jgi:hypothetical protein
MIYFSKGILPWKPPDTGISVSHCGALHKLAGARAALWLEGQYKPGYTQNAGQDTELKSLAELGIIECGSHEGAAALYRLLTNCSICPVRVKSKPVLLNQTERRAWKWIRRAGLRLTMAELVCLTENGIRPVPELLGEDNRQALTEAIYTTDTIYDGILEG